MGTVYDYKRPANERCPSADFLKDECERPMRSRFIGQMDALSKEGGGSSYENHQRFRPLRAKGKPLWEFKEHDHRLYCARFSRRDGRVDIILFNGWTKDKQGKTEREDREIEKAQSLYTEFLREYPGGDI